MRPPTLRLLLLPLLAPILAPILTPILTLSGCAKPRFAYEVDPSFSAAARRTVAMDPRKDLVLIREGQRPVDPGEFPQAVLAELAARRYQVAPPEAAELWVAVYVFADGAPGGRRAEPGGGGGKGGRSGGGRRGGGEGHRPLSQGEARPEPGARGGPARTVIVQLQDRKTGLPVWQGTANLEPSRPEDSAPRSPRELIQQLLKPLP